MSEFVSAHEPVIRAGVFFGLFAVLALTEFLRPRRPLVMSKQRRWFTNIAILLIDIGVSRLIFVSALVGVALWAQSNGYKYFETSSQSGVNINDALHYLFAEVVASLR